MTNECGEETRAKRPAATELGRCLAVEEGRDLFLVGWDARFLEPFVQVGEAHGLCGQAEGAHVSEACSAKLCSDGSNRIHARAVSNVPQL